VDPQEQVSEWLQSEGRQKGQPYNLNENGICVMTDDAGNECVVEVPRGSRIVYFYAPVVLVNPENRAESFEKAVTMNLYGLQTNESCLAYDPKVNRIILYYSAHIFFLEGTTFSNAFNNFLLTLQKVREDFSTNSVLSGSIQPAFQYPQLKV